MCCCGEDFHGFCARILILASNARVTATSLHCSLKCSISSAPIKLIKENMRFMALSVPFHDNTTRNPRSTVLPFHVETHSHSVGFISAPLPDSAFSAQTYSTRPSGQATTDVLLLQLLKETFGFFQRQGRGNRHHRERAPSGQAVEKPFVRDKRLRPIMLGSNNLFCQVALRVGEELLRGRGASSLDARIFGDISECHRKAANEARKLTEHPMLV